MKGRVNGVVYRGDAVYYTFQRVGTGLDYLKRLSKEGKDLKQFRVTMLRDGKEVKKSANEFTAWASKLKEPVASTNGKSKTKTAKAKKPAAKKSTTKRAAVKEPVDPAIAAEL